MSTIPQGPVEARSLSSVTTIASNPPAYPRNPTHEKHEPLSLYIVRVPGSKDIFLSPLKPPTKSSVSAEAINASLYYLHVATPDDDTLLQEVEEERAEEAQLRKERLEKAGGDSPVQHEFARLNNVRRKPVGGGGDPNPERSPTTPQQDATALPSRPIPVLQDKPASPALPPRPAFMPHAAASPTLPPRPISMPHAAASPTLPPRPIPMPQVTAENVSFSGTPVANIHMSGGVSGESGGKSGIRWRPLPSLPPGEESWANSPAGEDPSKRTSRWSAFAEQLQSRGENWKEKYEAKYEALSAGRHSLDSTRPQLRPRSSHNRPGSPLGSPGQSPNRHRNSNGNPPSNAGFHITLIRRDPTSGTQWNVATISTPRMDRNTVDIEISTPGYNRFAGSNELLSLSNLAVNIPTGIGRLPNSAIPQTLATEQSKEQSTGPRKFRRQLCVSKPFDDSAATDLSNGLNQDGPSSKLKSGYYVFTSPWNGTCTFTTSVNGRSLKCKHMIPTPGGFIPTNGETEAPPAVTVAELRFNTPFQAANLHSHAHHAVHKPHPNHISPFTQSQLQTPTIPRANDYPNDNNSYEESLHPSISNNSHAAAKRNPLTQLLNPNTYTRPRAHSGPGPNIPPLPASPPADSRPNFSPSTILRRTSMHAHRFARHSQHHSTSQSHSHRSTSNSSGGDLDHESDEDRLDFSLAREPAGGGLRGKSAKLGKLVIEDEGIKMLDLVVAACMAVWWRGYYY
ncbi:hypothetical protein DTO002I6_4377 [Penicillium roqueforti]|nr:hypothetical protein DTO002I6_4377 [Penicillium roqueforti]